MENLEEKDWSWIAGLVEGEGCFSFTNGWPVFQIQMTDKDVMSKLSLFLEVPLNGPHYKKGGTKPTYQIALRKTKKLKFISNKIYDYMGERRKNSIKMWREYWQSKNDNKEFSQILQNPDIC